MEFTRDGMVRMSTIGPAKPGKYQLDTANNLTIHMADGRRFRAKVRITGERLVLIDPDGTFTTFTRVE
jgi:hypothetical protein